MLTAVIGVNWKDEGKGSAAELFRAAHARIDFIEGSVGRRIEYVSFGAGHEEYITG